jgi:hypothetical protein
MFYNGYENKPLSAAQITDAKRAGYSAFAVINGEWFDIAVDGQETDHAKRKAAELVKQLILGREIVVVSASVDYDSAIFWLRGNTRYSFAKEIGECAVPFDRDATEEHFCKMLQEGGFLFARGACK